MSGQRQQNAATGHAPFLACATTCHRSDNDKKIWTIDNALHCVKRKKQKEEKSTRLFSFLMYARNGTMLGYLHISLVTKPMLRCTPSHTNDSLAAQQRPTRASRCGASSAHCAL